MNSFEEIINVAMESAKSKMKNVNILIVGKSGVGKSTLINAVFEGNLATTGIGRPVTSSIKEYKKEGIPIVLTDTVGLEISKYSDIKTQLEGYIKNKNNDTNPDNHIHLAWLCIDENSKRVEDAESDLCHYLSEKLPVVVVITKAINDGGFRREVQELLPDAKNVVSVNSISFSIGDHLVPTSGLKELVEISVQLVPEAQRMAFASAQKVDINQKIRIAHGLVTAAAAAAATAAAVPIPFSDAIAIVPIQVGMLASISYAMGLKLEKALLTTLVSSTITGAGASLIGREIVANIIKFFPGLGSVVGGFISAGVASTLTVLFGEAYIKTLQILLTNSNPEDINMSDITEEFKKQLKIND